MRRALCLLAVLTALALPRPGLAQDDDAPPALLVADAVNVEGDDRLVATGNVEVLFDGVRLIATSIAYNGATEELEIEGPIRIIDEEGTILTADAATLDQGLKNGLLKGARLVLNQQLQLASVEARRVDGRYTQLSKVAVTSCQVCANNKTPLWQIRASRVIHDQEERQLYFDEAQFRVLDVPIFYLPRLRLPDPTVKRARGFLIPTVRSSSLLGFGIKVPYFFPIGDHQDITLTPYLSQETRTLEFRYRRAFRKGDIEVLGAISSDTLRPDQVRGYLFAKGGFNLQNDFKLDFDLKAVSDNAYLDNYGLSGRDRLDSTLSIRRIKRDTFFQAAFVHYESLRASEDNDTQPALVGEVRYQKRLFPELLGGELRLSAEAHTHFRYSSVAVDGPDADNVVDGRDVARINAEISWRDRWTLPGGVRLGLATHLWLDSYETRQDLGSDARVSSATPGIAVDLRLPLQRKGAQGGRTLIEPLMQLGWVGGERLNNPNDESTRVEFDEANLLSLSRFPAADRREHGTTLAAGLRWMHEAPQGWTAALTLGKVWRDTRDTDYSRSSGLKGEESDWLVAGRFSHHSGLTFSARGLLDSQARFSKAEARADWTNKRLDLGASYLLLVTDVAEDRPEAQSEWTLDSTYRINTHWSTSLEARYNLTDRRLDRTGVGLQYQNECVQVDLSATRRFASATNMEPSTDFDLSIALNGFNANGSGKEFRRTCDH